MSERIRTKMLSLLYKNQSKALEKMLPEIGPELIGEALEVCFDYAHAECAQLLLPLASAQDKSNLLDIAMVSEQAYEQDKLLALLLPDFNEKECERVAIRCCEYGWSDVFSQVVDRAPEHRRNSLKLDWAATQGNLNEVRVFLDKCSGAERDRAMYLAAECSRWETVKFLIPFCNARKVLEDFETEQYYQHGSYLNTIEQLKNMIETVECEQQRERLSVNIEVNALSSKRKL